MKKSSGEIGFVRIDTIFVEAKSVEEDISDGLDYDFYQNAKEKFEKYLNELNRGGGDSDQYTFVKNYVQKMVNKLALVPDSNDVLKKMKYLDKNIPTDLKELRKRLAQCKTIDSKSKLETKKSFIENAERTLSSCSRVTNVYEKADKMFTELEADFKKSTYQTSEYKECQELWKKIKQAKPELENEVSALSTAVAVVKAKLTPAPAGE